MIALESVGIPVPGETVLVAAAIYAGTTHQLHIASVIGAAIIGAIVGNVVAFSIGQVYRYRLLRRYGGYLHLNESRIKIGQYLFLRHGGKVVFVARFVPVLRGVAGILAPYALAKLHGGERGWRGRVGWDRLQRSVCVRRSINEACCPSWRCVERCRGRDQRGCRSIHRAARAGACNRSRAGAAPRNASASDETSRVADVGGSERVIASVDLRITACKTPFARHRRRPPRCYNVWPG